MNIGIRYSFFILALFFSISVYPTSDVSVETSTDTIQDDDKEVVSEEVQHDKIEMVWWKKVAACIGSACVVGIFLILKKRHNPSVDDRSTTLLKDLLLDKKLGDGVAITLLIVTDFSWIEKLTDSDFITFKEGVEEIVREAQRDYDEHGGVFCDSRYNKHHSKITTLRNSCSNFQR